MASSFIPSRNKNNKQVDIQSHDLCKDAMPQHVAIIMDGNNRWAKNKFAPGISGHKAGVETIRKVLNVCEELDISILTLFAFSSENWARPDKEVKELMRLLKRYLEKEVASLDDKGICIRFIGRRDRLSSDIVSLMARAESQTSSNTVSTLVLAIDYGGRWDVANAAKEAVKTLHKNAVLDQGEGLDLINEDLISQHMALADLPPPDLCIRTGAEQRISNFLLWQFAYAELYFTDCYWPDFDEQAMQQALSEYASRQRRFGKTSQQIELDASNQGVNQKKGDTYHNA